MEGKGKEVDHHASSSMGMKERQTGSLPPPHQAGSPSSLTDAPTHTPALPSVSSSLVSEPSSHRSSPRPVVAPLPVPPPSCTMSFAALQRVERRRRKLSVYEAEWEAGISERLAMSEALMMMMVSCEEEAARAAVHHEVPNGSPAETSLDTENGSSSSTLGREEKRRKRKGKAKQTIEEKEEEESKMDTFALPRLQALHETHFSDSIVREVDGAVYARWMAEKSSRGEVKREVEVEVIPPCTKEADSEKESAASLRDEDFESFDIEAIPPHVFGDSTAPEENAQKEPTGSCTDAPQEDGKDSLSEASTVPSLRLSTTTAEEMEPSPPIASQAVPFGWETLSELMQYMHVPPSPTPSSTTPLDGSFSLPRLGALDGTSPSMAFTTSSRPPHEEDPHRGGSGTAGGIPFPFVVSYTPLPPSDCLALLWFLMSLREQTLSQLPSSVQELVQRTLWQVKREHCERSTTVPEDGSRQGGTADRDGPPQVEDVQDTPETPPTTTEPFPSSKGPLLEWKDIIQYLDTAPAPRRGFTEDLSFPPPKEGAKLEEGRVAMASSSLFPGGAPFAMVTSPPFAFTLDYRRPAFVFTLYLENISLQNALGHICMLFSLPLHSFHTRTQCGKMTCTSLLCALAPGCLCRHHLLLLNTLRYPGFALRVSRIQEVPHVREGTPKDVTNFFGALARWQPVYYTEILLRRVSVRDHDGGGRQRDATLLSPREILEKRIHAIRELGAIHFCLNRDTALARAASDVLHGYYKSAVFHALQRPYPPLAMTQFFRSPSEITASKARAVSTDATIRGILKAYLQVEGNWEATVQRTPYAWRRRWLNALRGIVWNVMASKRIRYGHRLYRDELEQWRRAQQTTGALPTPSSPLPRPRPYQVMIGDVVVRPEYREDARQRQILTLKTEFLMVVRTREEAEACKLEDVYLPFLRGKYPDEFFAPEDSGHPVMRHTTMRSILEQRSALALLMGLPLRAQQLLDARSERSPLLFRRLLIRPLGLSVDILPDKVPLATHAQHYDAARLLQPDRWPRSYAPRLYSGAETGLRPPLCLPSPQETDVLSVCPILGGEKDGRRAAVYSGHPVHGEVAHQDVPMTPSSTERDAKSSGALVPREEVLAYSSMGRRLPPGVLPSEFFIPPEPSDYLVLAQTHRFDRAGGAPFSRGGGALTDASTGPSADPVLLSSPPLTPAEHLQDKVYTLHIKAICHSAAVGLSQILREYFILSGVRETQEGNRESSHTSASSPGSPFSSSSSAMDDETLQHKIHRYWRELDPETPLLTAESYCPICYNRDHVSPEQCAEYLWKRMKERRTRAQQEMVHTTTSSSSLKRTEEGSAAPSTSGKPKRTLGLLDGERGSTLAAGAEGHETLPTSREPSTLLVASSTASQEPADLLPFPPTSTRDKKRSCEKRTERGSGRTAAITPMSLRFHMEWELRRPSRLSKWGLHFTKSTLRLTGVDTPEVVHQVRLWCEGQSTTEEGNLFSSSPSEMSAPVSLSPPTTTTMAPWTHRWKVPLEDVIRHWKGKIAETTEGKKNEGTTSSSTTSSSFWSMEWGRALRQFLTPLVNLSATRFHALTARLSRKEAEMELQTTTAIATVTSLDAASLKRLHTLLPADGVAHTATPPPSSTPPAMDKEDAFCTPNHQKASAAKDFTPSMLSACQWTLTSIHQRPVHSIHDVAEAYLSFSHQRHLTVQFTTPWTPADAYQLPPSGVGGEAADEEGRKKEQKLPIAITGKEEGNERAEAPEAPWWKTYRAHRSPSLDTSLDACALLPSHHVHVLGVQDDEQRHATALPPLPSALYVEITEPLVPEGNQPQSPGKPSSRGWGLQVLSNLRLMNLEAWVRKSFAWEQAHQEYLQERQLWVRTHGRKREEGGAPKEMEEANGPPLKTKPVVFHASSPPPSTIFFSSWADTLRRHLDPQHPQALLASPSIREEFTAPSSSSLLLGPRMESDYERYYILFRINGTRVKSIQDIPSLLPPVPDSTRNSASDEIGVTMVQLELRLREQPREGTGRKNSSQLEGAVRHNQILAQVVQRMHAHTSWGKEKEPTASDSTSESPSTGPPTATPSSTTSQKRQGGAGEQREKDGRLLPRGEAAGEERHRTAVHGTSTTCPLSTGEKETDAAAVDVLCTSLTHQQLLPESEVGPLRQATVTVHRPLPSPPTVPVNPPKWGITLKKHSLLLRHIEYRHGYHFRVFAYTTAQIRRLERGLRKLPPPVTSHHASSLVEARVNGSEGDGEDDGSGASTAAAALPPTRAYRSHLYVLEEVNHLPIRTPHMARAALQQVSRGQSLEAWRRNEEAATHTLFHKTPCVVTSPLCEDHTHEAASSASSSQRIPLSSSSSSHIPEVVQLRIRDYPLLRITVTISRGAALPKGEAANQQTPGRAKTDLPTTIEDDDATAVDPSLHHASLSSMYTPIGLQVDPDVCLISLSPNSPAMMALRKCGVAPHCSLQRLLVQSEGKQGGISDKDDDDAPEVWNAGSLSEGPRHKRRGEEGDNREEKGKHGVVYKSRVCTLCAFPSLVVPLQQLLQAVYSNDSPSSRRRGEEVEDGKARRCSSHTDPLSLHDSFSMSEESASQSRMPFTGGWRRPVAGTLPTTSLRHASPAYDWDRDDDDDETDPPRAQAKLESLQKPYHEEDTALQEEKEKQGKTDAEKEPTTRESGVCAAEEASANAVASLPSKRGEETKEKAIDGRALTSVEEGEREVEPSAAAQMTLAVCEAAWKSRVEQAARVVEEKMKEMQQALRRCSRVDGCQVIQMESLNYFLSELHELLFVSSRASRPLTDDTEGPDRRTTTIPEKDVNKLLDQLYEEWENSYRQVQWRVVYATQAKKVIHTPKDLAEVFAPGVMEETIILQQCVFA